ncbi:NAD/NADP octopine/nopaline dehydrogenase family protein [Paraburkholderia caribensis]|uniref:NAD/NADP octopine/nopaline dehydrogenase family protein n=1 Tax=Paraburkholderia caribensis TaxID=75105 RepID=UPI001F279B69|nr:NAD/NADP-dependent octopine/nopaline dehydrogenase family protein [Paraburkholderia caribensis]
MSDDPADVVTDAEMVILAIPHMARESTLRRIAPFLDSGTWLAGVPGFGGLIWTARLVLGPDQRVLGLQRVPYVRKVVSYGEVVWVSGIRPQLFVATVPSAEAPKAAILLQAMLNIPTKPLNHFLDVCLSNSNPIFHPSRLYSLWTRETSDLVWRHRPQFYEEWDEPASRVYLACESDLQAIAASCPTDLSDRQTLLEHYGVKTSSEVTETIRRIAALRDRPVPMREVDGGWTPDLHTYYFTEDIPYGIVIQRALAEIVKVSTPMLDEVISWAQSWMKKTWLDAGGNIAVDALSLPVPQRLGVRDAKDLVEVLR